MVNLIFLQLGLAVETDPTMRLDKRDYVVAGELAFGSEHSRSTHFRIGNHFLWVRRPVGLFLGADGFCVPLAPCLSVS